MKAANASIGSKTTKNSLYSMLSSIWYLGSRFLLTPFILHYLSLEEYGLWSLCFVVISFLSLSSMGLEGAYIKYIAEFHASGRMEKANRLLSTGLFLTCGIALALLGLVWSGMEPLLKLLKIAPQYQEISRVLLLGTAAVFALDITFNCFGRALDGLQHLALTARVRVGTSILELGLIVVLLRAGHGVNGLMWAFLFRYLLAIAINMYFAYRLVPGLCISPRLCDGESLRLLVRYGGRMQLLGVIAIFMSTFDRLIITRLLGLAATGIYEIGRKIPLTGARLPADISGAVMPVLSQLQAQGNEGQARTLYLEAARYMGMLTAVLFTYFLAVAPWAIEVWLGNGFGQAVSVMYAICAGKLVHLLTGASSAAARGMNRLDWELRAEAINLALGIILIPLLAYHHGLVGAAAGTAISSTLASITFIARTNRHFHISARHYAAEVLHPLACAAASALLCHMALSSLAGIMQPNRGWLALLLAGSGGLHLVLTAILLFLSRGIKTSEKSRIGEMFVFRLFPRRNHQPKESTPSTSNSIDGVGMTAAIMPPIVSPKE